MRKGVVFHCLRSFFFPFSSLYDSYSLAYAHGTHFEFRNPWTAMSEATFNKRRCFSLLLQRNAHLYFYKGTHISTFTKERTSLLLQRNAHLYFHKGTHINYVHSCVIVDAGSSNHSQHEREATKACTVLERQLYLLLSWIPSSTSTVHTN